MVAENPFRPGFGAGPPHLVGRDDLLAWVDRSAAALAETGLPPGLLILLGYRGVGKTVLLSEIARRLGSSYGWPAVHLEAGSDEPLWASIGAELRSFVDTVATRPRPGFRLDQASIEARLPGLAAGLGWTRAVPETSDVPSSVGRAIADAADLAGQAGTGLVVTVDEAQQLGSSELRGLAAGLQRAQRRELPLFPILAGLADLRSKAGGSTYLERARWTELENLTVVDTMTALAAPAATAGRPFVPGALEAIAAATGGYPYAVQLFGQHAWAISSGATHIEGEHVAAAIRTATVDLEHGLFAMRWLQASPRQREYLAAVAELRATRSAVTGADVSRHLGRRAQQLSGPRAELLAKGTLIVVGNNIDFPIPGMGHYMLRRSAEERTIAQSPTDGQTPPPPRPDGR